MSTEAGSPPSARQALREWRHTIPGRRCVQAWRFATEPVEWFRRRSAARIALRDAAALHVVDPRTGYAQFAPGELEGTDALLAACERELDRARDHLEPARSRRPDKPRLVADLVSDPLLQRDPTLVRFVLQNRLLLPSIRYLHTVPYLARISIAISFHLPDATEPVYFQRFHVDNDDYCQLKLYLNVRTTSVEEGPLTFLPAETSARVLAALRSAGRPVRRTTTFTDEEVFRHCDPTELVRVTGEPGSAALIDLSRCLHFGSRVHAGRERVVFGATILRYHRLHENPSNHIDAGLVRGDVLREMALRGPRKYASGHFYPEVVPEPTTSGALDG